METIHIAAARNDVPSIEEMLLRNPKDVHNVDYEGRTALHVAASNGHLEAVKALLAAGADPGAKTAFTFLTPVELCPARSAIVRAVLADSVKSTGHSCKSPIRHGVRLRGRVGRTSPTTSRRSESPAPPTQPANPSPRDSGDASNEDLVETNKIESAEVVNPRVMRKVIIVVLLPLVTLMFVNGFVFALKFLMVTSLFYFLVVGYFISEITIRPPWYHHHPTSKKLTSKGCPEYWEGHTNDPMEDFGLAFEDVTIASSDGYSLSGWYVPAPHGGTANDLCVVLVHGGGRDRRAWLRHLPMFHQRGYAALLFDFREHGLSSGNCNGFVYGMKERFDVMAAARFAKVHKHHSKVVVVGTSVGGSAVIMAAALDKENIDGVVAENAITTCALLQDYIIMNLFGGYFSRHWLSVYVFNAFRLTCSSWLNFRVGNKPSKHCQALHCVHKISPRPLLLMHGSNDDVVPFSHSEALYRAAREPKEFWECDGGFHCGLYNREPLEFERRVFALIERVEKGAATK